MTFLALKEYLEAKCKNITTTINEKDEELNYLDDFFSTNSLTHIKDFAYIDEKKFFVSYIISNSNEHTIEELERIFDDHQDELLSPYGLDIGAFLSTIIRQDSDEFYDEILKCLETGKKPKLPRKKLFDIETTTQNLLLKILLSDEELARQQLSMLKLYKKEPEIVVEVLNLIQASKELKQELEDIEVAKELYEEHIHGHVRNREHKENINRMIKTSFNTKAILEDIQSIKNYRTKKDKEKKVQEREGRKLVNVYQNLITSLELELKKDEIVNYKTLINKITDPKIRLEVLKIVYSHNIKNYQTLEETYIELEQNSTAKYHALLVEYNLDKEDYSIELIMRNSYSSVKTILETLKKMHINQPEVLTYIIQETNLERLEKVKELHEKNILTTKSISEHKELLSTREDDYLILETNLQLLQDKKVNALSFTFDINSLLTKTQQFKTNVDTLEEYHLLNKVTNEIDLAFISQKNLNKKIDMILELGYEEYLVEDLTLLNYDTTKWKRLQILKTLNIPVDSKDELEEILESQNFMVDDSIIDQYIFTVEQPKDETEEEKLEKFKGTILETLDEGNNNTTRTIKINDIILSRNRINRNLESIPDDESITTEQLMTAIVKDSIIDRDDYQKITTEVYKKLTR